jgi:hypothetical protein
MNAVPPRLVTARCHNAARIWNAANDYRLISILRKIPLFNSGKKSVHIDMDNFAVMFWCHEE